ncbi:MAG: hypothetical protein AAGB01_03490, partial [Cyanobacteria bacterium P01_F01_bin.42]
MPDCIFHRLFRLPLRHSLRVGQVCLATTAFTGMQFWPFIRQAIAQNVLPGVVIENQATGSYVDPADGSSYGLESNVVQVTVAEIAGVTLTPAGIQEAGSTDSNPGANTFDAEDVVYFLFTATNVGNDPTQFFIPGTPSSISNGTQAGAIEVVAFDPDGAGPTAPTDYSNSPLTVRPEGNNTGDATVMGMPLGAIPIDGTITLRVPVKLDAGLSSNAIVSLTLGDVGPNNNSAATQNQDYVDDGSNQDFYTQDNSDQDGIADEGIGMPANGDSTFRRKEASATSSLQIGDSNSESHIMSGFAFRDDNGSDDQSTGEPGLENITVRLYVDSNNDGELTVADDSDGDGDIDIDDAIATTTTDATGFYQFNRPNGDYLIEVDTSDNDLNGLVYGGLPTDPLNVPRRVTINNADV